LKWTDGQQTTVLAHPNPKNRQQLGKQTSNLGATSSTKLGEKQGQEERQAITLGVDPERLLSPGPGRGNTIAGGLEEVLQPGEPSERLE
jgi:hypothetical protein